MKRSAIIRLIILMCLWVPTAMWCVHYAIKEKKQTRLDALVLSNGLISSIQQEGWFKPTRGIQANDKILWIGGKTFDLVRVKKWLSRQKPNRRAKVIVERNGKRVSTSVKLRKYRDSTFFALFVIPFILSLLFFCFAYAIPLNRFNYRRSREAAEVFSVFCYGISIFFLTFFPAVTSQEKGKCLAPMDFLKCYLYFRIGPEWF